MLPALLLACLMSLCCANVIHNYKDCGSRGGTIHSVEVPLCTHEPCQLHRGTTYEINVNFTATEHSNTATTVVHGILLGIPLPFPVPSDSCKDHNVHCPVEPGTEISYHNSIYCNPSYPKVRVTAKWEIRDDNHRPMICFEIPLQIVS
ncbi:hypothetical protein CHS0354_008728 [Potamilus streckersoni]|uniref:MD-2-related lipid-recognition domain-containing protein n=1 Tax=Potamilus streckersoni TaxID=2493646 RepID=A0AAE0VT11_9BIVA|nr:hypothetical protein CHS0354_008728 [Potamilus streckersoni]